MHCSVSTDLFLHLHVAFHKLTTNLGNPAPALSRVRHTYKPSHVPAAIETKATKPHSYAMSSDVTSPLKQSVYKNHCSIMRDTKWCIGSLQ